MNEQEAFDKLDINKFTLHYLFGEQIKEFAEHYRYGFCANEFCFRTNKYISKGIICLQSSRREFNLKFESYMVLAKKDVVFMNEALGLHDGQALFIKITYNSYERYSYNYEVLYFVEVKEGNISEGIDVCTQ